LDSDDVVAQLTKELAEYRKELQDKRISKDEEEDASVDSMPKFDCNICFKSKLDITINHESL
jgi:hypothetical protein